MYKSIIVDDEQLARKLVEEYLGRLDNFEVAGSFNNPLDAISFLQKEKVDVLFLDIQMPQISGLELLKTLSHKPLVIIISAYQQYALEGFELDVVDYLLKPVRFERFLKAIVKTTELLELRKGRGEVAVQLTEPQIESMTSVKDYITVKSDKKLHRINFDDMLYIEGLREYLNFYTTDGRIIVLKTFKELEAELPADRFIRIHKSYMVNRQKVKALKGNLLEVGDADLPIGKTYKDVVMKELF